MKKLKQHEIDALPTRARVQYHLDRAVLNSKRADRSMQVAVWALGVSLAAQVLNMVGRMAGWWS